MKFDKRTTYQSRPDYIFEILSRIKDLSEDLELYPNKSMEIIIIYACIQEMRRVMN